MKLKHVIFLLVSLNLHANPLTLKLLNRMKDINEALIQVVNLPTDTKKQVAALERAKILVQEAIQVDGITSNASLYAIGAILFDDPVYRERAVFLDKQLHSGKDSDRLKARHDVLENEGESYRQNLMESIEDIEMLLRSSYLNDDQKLAMETRRMALEKTKKWVEAQIISHGMLSAALYQHKLAQLTNIEMGESSVQPK